MCTFRLQFIYSLAILLSTPLQLFPAIKIMENGLFAKSGKYNPYIKWQKNVFRFIVVFATALISWGGADDLDKFVALIGSFACVPLVYMYPVSANSYRLRGVMLKIGSSSQPLLHYKSVARTRLSKAVDIFFVVFGTVVMVYTTTLTMKSWIKGASGNKPPSYCDHR
jgi:proton-coupled amino acid transporter